MSTSTFNFDLRPAYTLTGLFTPLFPFPFFFSSGSSSSFFSSGSSSSFFSSGSSSSFFSTSIVSIYNTCVHNYNCTIPFSSDNCKMTFSNDNCKLTFSTISILYLQTVSAPPLFCPSHPEHILRTLPPSSIRRNSVSTGAFLLLLLPTIHQHF